MTTPILGMAEIIESQASKHLTHNDANRVLEAIACGVVTSATTSAEPGAGAFADGDMYILPASPTGAAWVTYAQHDIVIAVGGGWVRITPNARMRLHKYVEDTDSWTAWDGAAWAAAGAPGTGTGTGPVTPPGPTGPVVAVRLLVESNHGGTFTEIDELQFRQTAGTGVNHASAGDVAFASSVYSANAVHQAAAAFDGLITTSIWASAISAVFPQFVGLILAAPTTDPFVELYIDNGGIGTTIPNDCRVQTSTDTTDGTDGTWIDVASITVAHVAGAQTFAL